MDHIMFTQQKIHVKIDRTQCRNCDRKQILFFSFIHSIFAFRSDRIFQIFLSIICLHSQLFVVWQKWILNFKIIPYVQSTIVLFCKKEKKKKNYQDNICSFFLSIFHVMFFNLKVYHCCCKIIKFIFEISRINETFVYARVLFMDTHISHYNGIFDLRYACQLVSLYTREINKTTYFLEFQYQRNSCSIP